MKNKSPWRNQINAIAREKDKAKKALDKIPAFDDWAKGKVDELNDKIENSLYIDELNQKIADLHEVGDEK